MSRASAAADAVVVENDGARVEKRFTADEFPLPAVRFTLRSERDDPAEFRLTDRVPEELPMERVGFHPDYGAEYWTAYEDRRIEYRRRLDPGEEVTTVYGVRTDDDGTAFRTEPTVERVSDDADPVGGATDAIVAGMVGDGPPADPAGGAIGGTAAGDGDPDPSAEPSGAGTDPFASPENDPFDPAVIAEADAPADAHADEQIGVDAGFDGANDAAPADEPVAETPEPEPDGGTTTRVAGPAVGDDGGAAGATETGADEGITATGRVGAEATVDSDPTADAGATGVDAAGADEETTAGADAGPSEGDGLAAALAAELRAGTVSAADRRILRRELDLDGTRSTGVDARISHLQSSVADLEAYTDALEAFIDDNGTAEELAEGVKAEVADLRETLAAVEAETDAAAAERDELDSGLESVREDVAGLETELSAATDDLEASLSGVRDSVGQLEGRIAAADVEGVEAEVTALSGRIDREVGGLRADLDEVRAEMRGFAAFRDRLSSAFGAAGGAGAADGE